MADNISALKSLYDALGGVLSNISADATNAEVINAIATLIDNGGGSVLPSVSNTDNGDVLTVVNGTWSKADAPSSLPAVTAADNGDVLAVVNGAWDKADAPSGGGGDIFTVNFEVSMDDNGPVAAADKTFGEIVSAYEAGKTILGRALFFETAPARVTMDTVIDGVVANHASFYFCYVGMNDTAPSVGDVMMYVVIAWDDGRESWIVQGGPYQLTPAS